jgi:hypothetical protein
MDFVDYIEFVANKLRNADKIEYLRLVILLRDTCNKTIKKLEKQV